MVAAELVRRRPDVILASGMVQALAAKGATSTIPIVVVVTDAVDLGLIKSFAKPGGNVTGINVDGAAMAGKHVEILKLLIPRLSRVALLGLDGGQPLWSQWLIQARAAGGALGIAISDVLIKNIVELEPALANLAAKRVDAVIASSHAIFVVNAARLANLSLKYKIALAHHSPRTVEAGALLGYDSDSAAIGRRMAQHIDKILKGASPADIPVESPTRYKLAINLKTARLLGIEIPESILNLADRVIE
jgi:putative ABC transport system substrate-binding protein